MATTRHVIFHRVRRAGVPSAHDCEHSTEIRRVRGIDRVVSIIESPASARHTPEAGWEIVGGDAVLVDSVARAEHADDRGNMALFVPKAAGRTIPGADLRRLRRAVLAFRLNPPCQRTDKRRKLTPDKLSAFHLILDALERRGIKVTVGGKPIHDTGSESGLSKAKKDKLRPKTKLSEVGTRNSIHEFYARHRAALHALERGEPVTMPDAGGSVGYHALNPDDADHEKLEAPSHAIMRGMIANSGGDDGTAKKAADDAAAAVLKAIEAMTENGASYWEVYREMFREFRTDLERETWGGSLLRYLERHAGVPGLSGNRRAKEQIVRRRKGKEAAPHHKKARSLALALTEAYLGRDVSAVKKRLLPRKAGVR